MRGAGSLPLAPSTRRACLYVFVANLGLLGDAYGQSFASAVGRELRDRLLDRFVADASVDFRALQDDCFLLWSNAAFEAPEAGTPNPSVALESLVLELAQRPLRQGGIEALARLEVGWLELPDPQQLSAADIEFALYSAQSSGDLGSHFQEGWRTRFRSDMDVAVQVADAMEAGRINWRWHPVTDAHAQSQALYHSGSLDMSAKTSHSWSMEAMLPSLERTGWVRLLDRATVLQTLALLQQSRSPASLGARISAQSARLDHFWASLLRFLRAQPLLARRLVVEITASAALPCLEQARDLCMQLQLCGCRIAVIGFGRSALGLDALLACRPDIVQLDELFVQRAKEGDFGLQSLEDLLGMCAHLTTHVVVAGIEDESDQHAALQASARWLRGSLFGQIDGPIAQPATKNIAPHPLRRTRGRLPLAPAFGMAGSAPCTQVRAFRPVAWG